jgi:hypothetical protein
MSTRRFSFFSSAASRDANDDTASVNSEKTGSLSTSDTASAGDGFFWGKRAVNVLGGLADGTGVIDENIDELMKNLYQDPDILEKVCILSAKGLSAADMDNSKALTLSDTPMTSALSGPVTINTKTTESVMDELGDEYFTHDFDPVERLLYDVSNWDKMELTEQFMLKIEETDSNKDFILGKLADMIEANYSELMTCMRDANDINTDLTRAVNQITYARRQIAQGCDLLDKGSIRIAKLQIDRDRQQLIADSMTSLKLVKDLFKTVQKNITTGDLGYAAECASTLLEWLHSDLYSQFRVLEEVGQHVHKQLLVIRQKTDKGLTRLCSRKFAVLEYNNLIKSYLLLDYICENLGGDISALNNCSNDGADATSPSKPVSPSSPFEEQIGCVEGLALRIQRNLFTDIEATLQSAALEFIYASQHKKRRAQQELHIQGAYSTMQMDEMFDLAECELEELYTRLSPDLIAPCIVRSCELLCDIVHTHYMITQWHRSPFDPRNEDKLFLHRSMDYRDEEEEDETTIQLGNLSTVGSLSEAVHNALKQDDTANRTATQAMMLSKDGDLLNGDDAAFSPTKDREIKLSRLRTARLAFAAEKLVQSRSHLWVRAVRRFFLYSVICFAIGAYYAGFNTYASDH